MDVLKSLKNMKKIEDSIFNFFGTNIPREYIEDLTECKYIISNEDISYILNNDVYSCEIYGRSLWKKDGYILAKVYSGSGEMYCVMLLECNLLNEEEFKNIELNMEKKNE